MERTKGRYRVGLSNEYAIICETPDAKLTTIAVCNVTEGIEEAKANAQFICTAVNNHDKLVEALKPFAELAKHFKGNYGMRPKEGEIQAWNDSSGEDALTVEMLLQAEQLLQSIKSK